MASYTDLGSSGPTKLSKSRSKKTVVKPILKKLSHSEKNSLDLDRGWDEQTSFGNYGGSLGREREGSFGGRDVSFSISATDLNTSSASTNTNNTGGRSKFSHARSTSGTSHVSIATNGSGHRNGSFVHPFQQTPRTSTPPLSYANSFASFDQGNNAGGVLPGPRDYSPTITEDDDDLLDQHFYHHPHHHLHHHRSTNSNSNNNYATPTSASVVNNSVTSYPRRPSLASRTSSLSDINNSSNNNGPPSLRINTASRTISNPTASSRLVHVSSQSEINVSGRSSESAAVPNTAPVLSPLSAASPSTSTTAMSPLRTSLEGFRLRSRSELDSNYHQERIREERRRWQEKERIKEAKRDREDMRKRERADTKEALRFEREQHLIRKDMQSQNKQVANDSAHKQSFSNSARNSSIDLIRPSISRKKTDRDAEKLAMGEIGFASRNYESTNQGQEPLADEVMAQGPRRSQTAKRKTQGAWTSFVLWFRTRILRLNNMAKR